MRVTALHKTLAHEEGVWSVAWVPGSAQVLTGSVDESVKLWKDDEEGIKLVHSYTVGGRKSMLVHSYNQIKWQGDKKSP
jgi:WD repeat-containing protein 61